jgi:nucleotide-binding universal stress UspA family protein
MIEIREILYPTDFSETSRHALDHAVVIAKWYEARITALHVRRAPLFPPPPILAAGFADAAPPAMPNYRECEEELRALLEPARRAGIELQVCIEEGTAARTILDYAHSRHSDLIVIGTHGLGGFERLMLGSVAEKVLRNAPCPVMIVPPAVETASKVPYTRLVCPVDFSDSSLAALRFAFSLAEEADGDLTILNVVDWPPDDELLVERFDGPEFRRVVEAQARDRLEALITSDMRVWCKPVTMLAFGKPYREILNIAEKQQSDLIVMGIHGRNPVDLTLFGSTTNHVVRRAKCPVLTLKPL